MIEQGMMANPIQFAFTNVVSHQHVWPIILETMQGGFAKWVCIQYHYRTQCNLDT